MSPRASCKAKHHTGEIVAMEADPHFCYSMGSEGAVVVSLAEGLSILCRIDLHEPVVVYNPRTSVSETSYVTSGKHLARPCSRWAMSQSFPNRRGVTPQGPRGFLFASATNDLNQGLLLKFDINRAHPLVVQCTLAHSNPIHVCVSGPYDNGPIITLGKEDTGIHFWDIHSLQLIIVISVEEPSYSVNSIAIHPQECFYSINTNGQIAVWRTHER